MNSPAPSSWSRRPGAATPATPQQDTSQQEASKEGRLSQAVQASDDSKPIFKDTAFLRPERIVLRIPPASTTTK